MKGELCVGQRDYYSVWYAPHAVGNTRALLLTSKDLPVPLAAGLQVDMAWHRHGKRAVGVMRHPEGLTVTTLSVSQEHLGNLLVMHALGVSKTNVRVQVVGVGHEGRGHTRALVRR